MLEVKTSPAGLVVKIYVQPKSSRNQVTGLHGDALKLKITSAPVAGAANRMCIRFVAQRLGIPKSGLEILSGHTSRSKRILIKSDPANLPSLRERIHSLLG